MRLPPENAMAAKPTPFSLHVGDDVLADLKSRLAHVRWPDEVPDKHWKYGTDLPYMKALVEYWGGRYDWRKHEADLTRFPQFRSSWRASTCISSVKKARGQNR